MGLIKWILTTSHINAFFLQNCPKVCIKSNGLNYPNIILSINFQLTDPIYWFLGQVQISLEAIGTEAKKQKMTHWQCPWYSNGNWASKGEGAFWLSKANLLTRPRNISQKEWYKKLRKEESKRSNPGEFPVLCPKETKYWRNNVGVGGGEENLPFAAFSLVSNA